MLRKKFSKPRNVIKHIEVSTKQPFEALREFIAAGGVFNPEFRHESCNELINIVKLVGVEGLKFFFENGGQVDLQHRTGNGWSEIMVIARYSGLDTLKIYLENGGEFNPLVQSTQGFTEAMFVAKYYGAEGIQLFLQKGGEFKWDRKDGNGKSERDYVLEAKAEEDKKQEALKNDPARQFVDDIKSGAVVPVKQKPQRYMK